MIGEFVLRIAMLTAVDADVPGVTALSAIGWDAQAILGQAAIQGRSTQVEHGSKSWAGAEGADKS